ncbi:unnamed protein product [Arctia plantaginis]|uniref:Uncharacterized protein n=1 Tax=Arctia plantaginis TaxID=874455 RepID=A0A8S0Z359_ARCPL|nr:unnamed protein product [Arctia plantaginis]CAB3254793.1 unnamed protein product [Arctia plantaginis]
MIEISEGEKNNNNESRIVEKRKERDEEGSAEDDFITIVRRRPKRMLRSEELEVENSMMKKPKLMQITKFVSVHSGQVTQTSCTGQTTSI